MCSFLLLNNEDPSWTTAIPSRFSWISGLPEISYQTKFWLILSFTTYLNCWKILKKFFWIVFWWIWKVGKVLIAKLLSLNRLRSWISPPQIFEFTCSIQRHSIYSFPYLQNRNFHFLVYGCWVVFPLRLCGTILSALSSAAFKAFVVLSDKYLLSFFFFFELSSILFPLAAHSSVEAWSCWSIILGNFLCYLLSLFMPSELSLGA